MKPALVRHAYPDEPLEATQSYNDALACVLRRCAPDPPAAACWWPTSSWPGCRLQSEALGGRADCVDAAPFAGSTT